MSEAKEDKVHALLQSWLACDKTLILSSDRFWQKFIFQQLGLVDTRILQMVALLFVKTQDNLGN